MPGSVGWVAIAVVVIFVIGLNVWAYRSERRESRLAGEDRAELYARRRRSAWWRVPTTLLVSAACGVAAVALSHDPNVPFGGGLVLGALAGLVVGLAIVSIFYPQKNPR